MLSDGTYWDVQITLTKPSASCVYGRVTHQVKTHNISRDHVDCEDLAQEDLVTDVGSEGQVITVSNKSYNWIKMRTLVGKDRKYTRTKGPRTGNVQTRGGRSGSIRGLIELPHPKNFPQLSEHGHTTKS